MDIDIDGNKSSKTVDVDEEADFDDVLGDLDRKSTFLVARGPHGSLMRVFPSLRVIALAKDGRVDIKAVSELAFLTMREAEAQRDGTLEDDSGEDGFAISIATKDGVLKARVTKNTRISKLVEFVRKERGIGNAPVRVEFDHDPLGETQRVGDTEIEEGDCLDAFY